MRLVANRVLPPLLPLIGLSGINAVEAGGRVLARLVTDQHIEGVSGRYFEGEKEARLPELPYDRRNAAELWETGAELASLVRPIIGPY